MKEKEIADIYKMLSEYYEKHLRDKGVNLPRLRKNGQFTKDALALVYLARNYPKTQIVSKQELTDFIRKFYPDVNDVQQARHLAAQKGWYILSGTRGDNNSLNISQGNYKLISLEESYPGFTHERRLFLEDDNYFEELKASYDYRCATCGSKEGEPHRYWKNTTTVLQKGHKNPAKPLENGNIIPQCEKCNRADRNYWIYDDKGRVIGIANEKVIDGCSKSMQEKIYERLKQILNK